MAYTPGRASPFSSCAVPGLRGEAHMPARHSPLIYEPGVPVSQVWHAGGGPPLRLVVAATELAPPHLAAPAVELADLDGARHLGPYLLAPAVDLLASSSTLLLPPLSSLLLLSLCLPLHPPSDLYRSDGRTGPEMGLPFF